MSHPSLACIEPEGASLLHTAIDKQDIVLLRDLLSAGADVNRRLSVEWATPLFAAVYLHAHDLVSLLLSFNANPNIGRQGRSPLALALTRGDVAMAKLLLYSGASPNDPPLSVAFTLLSSVRSTGGPWCELLHLLVCHGANLNVHTPLSQFERIVLDFRSQDLDIVTYLIAHGADLSFRTRPALIRLGKILQLSHAEDWKEVEARSIASQRWMEKL